MPAARPNWPRVAEKLAAAVPLGRLHPAVLRWAAASPPRERWAVALSGGADSVALLLLLWAHLPGRRARLLALHFDHSLRGRASAADARFCAALCRGLGLALVKDKWDRPRGAPAPSEAEARAARHAFFTAALRRRRVRALFTGHHRDDVAETMLMRLARGSGSGGLAAPRPVHEQPSLQRVHLRPLLALDKTELVEALRAAGGIWREDATNATGAHLRNRVRAELLPVWRAVSAEPGRDPLGGIALSRDLLEEDDAALEQWTDRVTRIEEDGGLALAPLKDLPRAVLRRVLRRWLVRGPAKTDIKRRGFDDLIDLISCPRPGARRSIGARHHARVKSGRLVWELTRRG
jgi:tRNA(Ile)-lysidine synthase